MTDEDRERLARLTDALRAGDADEVQAVADAILDDLRRKLDPPDQEPAVNRRRRIATLAAEVDRVTPSPAALEAAEGAIRDRLYARIRAAQGEDVELPDVALAEATLAQARRAAAIPEPTHAEVEQLRDKLRDRIARGMDDT